MNKNKHIFLSSSHIYFHSIYIVFFLFVLPLFKESIKQHQKYRYLVFAYYFYVPFLCSCSVYWVQTGAKIKLCRDQNHSQCVFLIFTILRFNILLQIKAKALQSLEWLYKFLTHISCQTSITKISFISIFTLNIIFSLTGVANAFHLMRNNGVVLKMTFLLFIKLYLRLNHKQT